jgi:alkylation response protein AidB-like acyl-CoA dehydrogenase
MDFTPTPEQQDAGDLAKRILGDRCSQERLREVEESGTRFDEKLWHELGDAGLLGLALPEDVGGGGLGLLELCSVIIETGRVVAPLPLAWHGPTALAIAELGSDAQRERWLPDAASGRSVLTTAVTEDRAFVPDRPTTTATRSGDGWTLSGVKTAVPSGTVADLFVVPADTSDGVTVFLVRPDDRGVSASGQTVNDSDQVARVELDDVTLDDDRVLGTAGNGAEVVHWLTQRLVVGLCALQLGVVEGALALTAEYARTREQFGRAIGTFQAVSQRLASGYIDVQGASLTLWQAAWRLSEGLPSDLEVATAKLVAADTGHTVAHTTVHVHGGVGIDLDGAAHRFYTAAKRHELSLGGGTDQARAVGRVLATEPA